MKKKEKSFSSIVLYLLLLLLLKKWRIFFLRVWTQKTPNGSFMCFLSVNCECFFSFSSAKNVKIIVNHSNVIIDGTSKHIKWMNLQTHRIVAFVEQQQIEIKLRIWIEFQFTFYLLYFQYIIYFPFDDTLYCRDCFSHFSRRSFTFSISFFVCCLFFFFYIIIPVISERFNDYSVPEIYFLCSFLW